MGCITHRETISLARVSTLIINPSILIEEYLPFNYPNICSACNRCGCLCGNTSNIMNILLIQYSTILIHMLLPYATTIVSVAKSINISGVY